MSGMKIRHDFGAGEETITGASKHHNELNSARDESSSLHKATQASLGDDVAGSTQVVSIAKQQFERDTTSIDSAARMQSGNQKSQDIQQQAAQAATTFFGNRG